jgi:hypothetical protein
MVLIAIFNKKSIMRYILLISVIILTACNKEEIVIEEESPLSIGSEAEDINFTNESDSTLSCDTLLKTLEIVDDEYKLRFELLVPEDWEYIPLRGFDSWVGSISNNEHTFEFDYGWYGHNLSDLINSSDTLLEHHNGLHMEMYTPINDGKTAMGIDSVFLMFDDSPEHTTTFSFYLFQTSQNQIPKELALSIYRSFNRKCYDNSKDRCYTE